MFVISAAAVNYSVREKVIDKHQRKLGGLLPYVVVAGITRLMEHRQIL